MRDEIRQIHRDIQDVKMLLYWISACLAGIGLGTMITSLKLVWTVK